MYFEFDEIDEFMRAIADVKCKKYYYIIEFKDYAIIKAVAQSVKNTYTIELAVDHTKLEGIMSLFDKNDFVKAKSIKGWEG